MLSTLLATPFGIPFSPATAILLGALVVHGLQPGPLMISQRPEVFWGFVASMYIGNLMRLILNLPLGRRLRDRAAPDAARPRDPRAAALSRRGLQPEQQLPGPVGARHLWRVRLRVAQAPGGPLPDGGRAGAGPDDGEDAAPGALPHPRQRRRPGGARCRRRS